MLNETAERGALSSSLDGLPQPRATGSPAATCEFGWSVGIESSTLPHLDVDQFEWTQHNRQWRDDLRLVAEDLGLEHLRYAVPWHYIEPERGRFDWRAADERLAACRELGLRVTLDVMHFGTPRWLTHAAGDPEFPEALERLAGAMAERYRGVVAGWCPVNEPLVTSLFSGDFGFWPPHGRGWRGYMPVLSRVAQATVRGIRAIRRTAPEATVMVCDAADHFQTREPALKEEAAFRNERRFLMLDLIDGRVDHRHPLFDWLTSYGFSELDLSWLAEHRQMPDLIGLDYYPHSDWQLELGHDGRPRQRRAESPAGLHAIASDFYERYGLPLTVTETSIEGKPINREIWLERLVEDARRLREEGVPLTGLTWWPLLDHLDWDGAMTHRIGKLHQVGLYRLAASGDGAMRRVRTPLADRFAALAAGGDDAVGELGELARPMLRPVHSERPLMGGRAGSPPAEGFRPVVSVAPTELRAPAATNGHAAVARGEAATNGSVRARRRTGEAGIVVFSHLRWGFVWQRPQQFLSRMARKHPVLFVEEPLFDVAEGGEARVELHQVMPNVTVACPHCPASMAERPEIVEWLRRWTLEAVERVNGDGSFDEPLLWYYSPMDSTWSLGLLPSRGVVYDCMDELSQFTGAPPELVEAERRLIEHADIVFTGGKKLWEKKSEQHPDTHFFGCGVEADHFGLAMEEGTPVPPDVDFMDRPIIGWFGVIDERVDYHLVAEMARLRPSWSFAMVGPVVKIDPNLLPHAPNLYWLGGRDYSVLPNYCKAFQVCMMCFALNDATEFINPTKALEYLATGRPVVSTPVRDVVEQYSDLMDIAATPEEFVAAIERAIRSPDAARIERGIERARSCTWDATVETMRGLIRDAAGREDRRSARPVRQAAGLPRRFQRTPGS